MNEIHYAGDQAADADLLTRVGIALTLRFHLALRAVEPRVARGEVTLRGELPTDALRRQAYEITRRVAGVRRVRNELTVRCEPLAGAPAASSTNLPAADRVGAPQSVARRSLIAAAPPALDSWPRRRSWVAAATALVLAAGCGEPALQRTSVFPTTGSITVKGQPAHGAIVVLHPQNAAAPSGLTPRANVDEQGRFAVSTYDRGDGAPEGDYVVTVMWFKPIKENGDFKAGPNVIPAKYSRAETSNLAVKIAAGQNVLPPLKL